MLTKGLVTGIEKSIKVNADIYSIKKNEFIEQADIRSLEKPKKLVAEDKPTKTKAKKNDGVEDKPMSNKTMELMDGDING